MRVTILTSCHAAIAAFLALQLCASPASASAPSGACCFPNLSCVELIEVTCEEGGGQFIGADTNCKIVECRRVEAPVLSILGLVGVIGALGGLGTYQLIRRRRSHKTA
jgi:hypothetical protein